MTIKFENGRYIATCDDPECPWEYVAKQATSETSFRIELSEHSWKVVDDYDHPQAATFCVKHPPKCMFQKKSEELDQHGGAADDEVLKVIEVWELTFCLGSAVERIARASKRPASMLEDLKKARWYLDREIARLEGATR